MNRIDEKQSLLTQRKSARIMAQECTQQLETRQNSKVSRKSGGDQSAGGQEDRPVSHEMGRFGILREKNSLPPPKHMERTRESPMLDTQR